ncbi:3-hydroxyisobutyrate dehydrogenase [Fusarium albosuccineum]|uniref:3-hydroxyisobutyrate dehydrogenase n=1 Tax=Fusarium albosuccineum TaxID=1237068 RepID=A0A8H4PGT2_9HYPO|nr:3-hydroxyisobutyrate dehydrogenase [Fusarium albosuccineum]
MADIAGIKDALWALERKAHGQVTISARQGGTFTLPKKLFVSGASDDEQTRVPSLAFVLVYQSPAAGPRRILFDLGLRRNTEDYTLPIQNHLRNRLPMQTLPDVRQSLLDGGLACQDIDEVILSHVHWDHIGTPADFPQARFFVGAGSLGVLKDGFNGHMSHSHFQHDLFDNLDVTEFSSPDGWQVAGGLHIHDLDAEGAVYVVDSPGHLLGHIALLARKGPRHWVLLIGDACHDSRLLTGEMSIAEWTDAEGRACCIHMDQKQAAETVEIFAQWKRASEHGGVELDIIFAHDATWAASHPDAFFPGTL